MELNYLVENNGKKSGTKTVLIVGSLIVLLRWALGGVDFGGDEGVTFSAISGLDAGALLAALGFNRGFSSKSAEEEKLNV